MQHKSFFLFSLILLLGVFVFSSFAVSAQDTAAGSSAILVVSFGTSYNDTRDITIGAIEEAIAAAFPDYEVRRAFTSQTIIDKLLSRDNLKINNVAEALEELIADGFTDIAVQPTHIMNGYEYEQLLAEIEPFIDSFNSVVIGAPLLSSTEDYFAVIDIINAEFPLEEGEVLVLMGHGTHHFANATYAALGYMLKDNGYGNVIVGTVESYPDVEVVLKQVGELNPTKVILAPLMIVAGDHASNDMAGDEEDSWKTIFKSEGYEVETVLRGFGEYKGTHDILISHLDAAIHGSGEEETAEE